MRMDNIDRSLRLVSECLSQMSVHEVRRNVRVKAKMELLGGMSYTLMGRFVDGCPTRNYIP